MQSSGRYSASSCSRNGPLNFTAGNLSSEMSSEMILERSAPFFRSLRASVYFRESSAEKNITRPGSRCSWSPCSIKQGLPVLTAAAMLHQTVVLPLPPSPARLVI